MVTRKSEVRADLAPPRWPVALTRASESYAEFLELRAAVQFIPFLGGSIDTVLAGLGTRWQTQRLLDFVQDLSARLARLESTQGIVPPVDPSEPFYDFVRQVFRHATESRSAARRKYLAQLVVHQVESRASWEEGETATSILSQVSDLEVEILLVAHRAPICESPFEGLRVITIRDDEREETGQQPVVLRDLFRDQPPHALRYAVAHLASLGLVYDAGAGRVGLRVLEYLAITDLGEWFLQWVVAEDG